MPQSFLSVCARVIQFFNTTVSSLPSNTPGCQSLRDIMAKEKEEEIQTKQVGGQSRSVGVTFSQCFIFTNFI